MTMLRARGGKTGGSCGASSSSGDQCGDREINSAACHPFAGGRSATIAMGRIAIGVAALLVLGAAEAFGNNSHQDIKVELDVPEEAEIGKEVQLKCNWTLSGNKTLYSVKWYKDEHEIFSYNPTFELEHRIKAHPREGVIIDKSMSNKNVIHLTGLKLSSSGQYKCEVSADSPFFATNLRAQNLTVISLPKGGPEIRGLASQYAVGENVTANCTAWPSVPQARLEWTINNKPVPREHIIEHPPHQPLSPQGTPNSLGLRFQIETRHFAGSSGTLRVRCLAKVGMRRYDAERHAQMTQASKQRYSAGDFRSGSATYLSSTLLTVLAAALAT